MDWKLTRGKFRPKLQALIGSNTEEAVKVASKAGLAVMSSAEPHAEPAEADLREAVKQLTKLKVRIAGCNLCAETPFQSISPQDNPDQMLRSCPCGACSLDQVAHIHSPCIRFLTPTQSFNWPLTIYIIAGGRTRHSLCRFGSHARLSALHV